MSATSAAARAASHVPGPISVIVSKQYAPVRAHVAAGSSGASPRRRPGSGNIYGTTRSCPGSSGRPAASQAAQAPARKPSRSGRGSPRATARRARRPPRRRACREHGLTDALGPRGQLGSRCPHPTQISPPGSCSRQSSLHTSGIPRLTAREYSGRVTPMSGTRLRDHGLRIGHSSRVPRTPSPTCPASPSATSPCCATSRSHRQDAASREPA